MYIGIDIGTGSARACLINEEGEILSVSTQPILRFTPKQDFVNQSSENIWNSICKVTKDVVRDSNVKPEDVKGIAFDATCSLIATKGPAGKETLPVGPDFTNKDEDVILWMDHRAAEETIKIKATGHPLLKFVGGQMSIEMEVPKMMWLSKHMPKENFDVAHFYDLSDWLTMHSTGIDARSFCSVACKQGYVPQGVEGSKTGWSKEFLTQVGLSSLTEDNFARLGGVDGINGIYHSAGEPVGNLTSEAASELGLTTKTVVGSGVIDAYSGWVGTVAAKTPELDAAENPVNSRLAAVAGTSTCHIVQSKEPVFVPGVWGPYRDVLVPGMWCAEGGQSTTGELISHVLTTHPAHAELELLAEKHNVNKFVLLNQQLEKIKIENKLPTIYHTIKDLFWYGDLYGNRSPIADPSMRGSVVGLSMDSSLDDLARQYLGVVEFVCLQQRQIIDSMNKAGHDIRSIYLSGGQCRNDVLTAYMAAAAQRPLVIPHYIDSAVVLGTAMLAAKASHPENSLWETMGTYSKDGKVVQPTSDNAVKALLDAKYEILLDQAERQKEYRKKVAEALQ